MLVPFVAAELGPHGITVNALAPASTATPRLGASDGILRAQRHRRTHRTGPPRTRASAWRVPRPHGLGVRTVEQRRRRRRAPRRGRRTLAVTADGAIPAGWSIELDPSARRTDGGRTLIGGTPLRVLRFTPAGTRWLDSIAAGEPLPPSPASRRLARRLVDAGLANPRPAMPRPLTPHDVAVVIPVRDDAEGLRRTIATVGNVGEVIVVDDGSHDATAVQRAAPGATILRNAASRGPGAARDRGWRETGSRFVAFVDADVELPEGWLAPLLAHLGDASVGAVAPRIGARPGHAPPWLAAYDKTRSSLDLGPMAGPVRPQARVPYVPTAALLVRRAALDSVAGFDERLQIGEDVDLIWRLHNQGWRVRYEPTVLASHPSRPNVQAWIWQRIQYGRSTAALGRRHGNAVAPLGISVWSGLVWSAVLFGRPATAVGIGAGTAAALAPKLRSIDHPLVESLRIAGKGNLRAGQYVADALRRPWWPLSLAIGLRCRRARPALLVAAMLPPLLEWRERRPSLGPIRFSALRLVDDVAYGTGVWIGCLREWSVGPLLPSFFGSLPSPHSAGPDDPR